jgi:uncharacterized protein YjiK
MNLNKYKAESMNMKKLRIEILFRCLVIALGMGGWPAFLAAQDAACPRIAGSESLGRPALKEIHSGNSDFRTLKEFSGLAFAPDKSGPGFSFWTVDDEQSFAIRFLATGEIVEAVQIAGGEDLEAIAFDAERERFAIISEQSGSVRFLQRQGASFQDKGGFALSQLPGYDGRDPQDPSGNTLKDYYENDTQFEQAKGDRPNNGWEGMTFTGDGRMFFLKEKNPAILIEVKLNEADLRQSSITNVTMLNCGSRKQGRLCQKMPKNAFIFPDQVTQDGKEENLDFSDLAYAQGTVWLTSDTGRSVISFNPQTKKHSIFPLEYATDKCLDSAEGVAVSGDGKQLFVVNDQPGQQDSRLLIYDLK